MWNRSWVAGSMTPLLHSTSATPVPRYIQNMLIWKLFNHYHWLKQLLGLCKGVTLSIHYWFGRWFWCILLVKRTVFNMCYVIDLQLVFNYGNGMTQCSYLTLIYTLPYRVVCSWALCQSAGWGIISHIQRQRSSFISVMHLKQSNGKKIYFFYQ